MNAEKKYKGVVVPMVTPISGGELDEEAVSRLVRSLLSGGVEGLLILGTTGEAASVPRAARRRLIELAVRHAAGQALIYAGLNDNCLSDTIESACAYFEAGADAVVTLQPCYFPLSASELLGYFRELLVRVPGPVFLYNIPSTTHASIPFEVIEQLAGHPRLAGIKDSENNSERLEALVHKFAGRPDFSVFIGVGALMGPMLLRGADGIVPSAANLVPELCRDLFVSARAQNRDKTAECAGLLREITRLYQDGRTLGQSLAALKAALSHKDLCRPEVLPPLRTLAGAELEKILQEMLRMKLLSPRLTGSSNLKEENPALTGL